MFELTDQNFEKEIQNASSPILVDFYAVWCSPCFLLFPILEKLEREYQDKIIFAKANLDVSPVAAQKFGINLIPTVVLFGKGKAISGFTGLQPEEAIRKWLEDHLENNLENDNQMIEKIVEEDKFSSPSFAVARLIEESEKYAGNNGFKLNSNQAVVKRIARGLLENEKKYGKRYCPCRRVIGLPEEDSKNICPCVYHLEELEKDGRCLCQLFVK